MQFIDKTNHDRENELRRLVAAGMADLIAKTNEHGYSQLELMAEIKAWMETGTSPSKTPHDPAAPDGELPAGPHSASDLTDDEKTPGTGALTEPDSNEIDPGVG